ncbi:Bug family tripartite tricarboxylate transporter substrate binding protein [Aquincola tertiaricarbonis]|uniref:Bug family tripartite tricarboxylate transporter substrate binding protein n=1 Tax=Aquincola tertiaricarbonis TaxID=391953 RepID=UPI000614BF09|nr:tripartite tricarboxylate transporter substrate binding protein [Aquincola tertiaricarbonis]
MSKLLTSFAALGVAATLAAPASWAQGWPDKPITLVVPFPPGGSTDSVARAIGPKLTERFGQTVVVDNKAGATGTIGAGAVKRAPADGYTFLVTSLGPLVLAPHLFKSVPYDAQKDFDYVTVAVQAPNVLVVPVASPHMTVADVIAQARTQPGKMTFASSGNGSSDHLTAALFWQQTGTSGSHIPYKGGAPAISDLLGGQVDASFQNVNAVLPHIRAGKLRALAVTGDKRSPVLPEVPTMAEAGVKNVDVYSWQAVVAPQGLPAEVYKRFHEAVVAALNDPGVKQQFTAIGLEVVANTPAQFRAFQAAEFARWKRVIEAGKITAD